MKRVGAFIDVQNIYMTTRQVFQRKINFRALRDYLVGQGDVVTLCAFTCYDPENRGQIDFINFLALSGYRVVSKPIRRIGENMVKANMDLEMAMEVLNQAPHLDEIILVTGDGDFVPLVNQLCLMGKVVKVIGPDQVTSPELIRACYEFFNLHEIQEILTAE